MYVVVFQIEALLSLKNAWLPPVFFWDTKSTCSVLLSLHNFKPRKNIPVLAGTTQETRVSRDAQNICAVTIVGTVLKLVPYRQYMRKFHLRASPENTFSSLFGRLSTLLAHILRRKFLFWCLLSLEKIASRALLRCLSWFHLLVVASASAERQTRSALQYSSPLTLF